MIRFFILTGYFEMTLYLYVSGKLDQYINLHYSYLAYLSMVLTFVLALIQLYIWVKQLEPHSHLSTKIAKCSSIALLLIPLLVAWGFPTVHLDSTTVAAKGYHFPLAAGADTEIQEQEGTTVQYLKPDTSAYFTKSSYQDQMRQVADRYLKQEIIHVTSENYMEIMEAIYDFPNEFVGKEIEMVGFVYNDPDNAHQQFLFRFGIIHCIADSGVYGLLSTGQSAKFPDNTWVSAKGSIQLTYHTSLQQALPTLELREYTKIEQPKNPYVYRVF
ncbi:MULTISPECIES: TIGR03943 family protein [unclassified Streptococcus]|uniref:TIGR03943 family putative permease subunit n=1 Tax=unclassified Streptococcus TaxID=2608887 RepID=UPI001071BF5F|nr:MULTISPECIES: TIGR03943 family protein [unclassified Streptococcus]MBF0786855.1 TIGR03943 family protein [Streptococcus sp. 19428wC2_LYSM12]MCQ9212734.1 TIGR03943 family protein [Streptococcus sp. B01]MCQ9214075.1 TIGR03943 family protein [Streptococcus sp. O1]TFV06225.1 TIGR03943 family protein [Streptococcus sp. LYSM12]